MKILRNIRYVFLGGIIVYSLFLISCGNSKEIAVDTIRLNDGAIIEKVDDNFKNCNLIEEKYDGVESESVIGLYDKETDRYVSMNNGEYKFFYDGKINEIDGVTKEAISLKLSPKGKYLTYFEEQDGVNNLKIHDLEKNKEVEFDSKVFISSTFMDWLDEDNIVYYGISEDRINAIFIYNIKTGKEEVFYKLTGGIVQYMKTLDKGLIYVHETVDNERVLKVIDKMASSEIILSRDVMWIEDIVKSDDSYYFIGKVKGNNEALYRISNGKLKRMVFDFPKEIDLNKGLSKTPKGDILFIGKSDKNKREEQVYKLTKEGSISLLKESSKEYSFVKINE